MATNWPTGFDEPVDPNPTDPTSLPSHSGLHTDLNNQIEALQAFLGITGAFNVAQVSGATFTGAVSGPTPPDNDNSTLLATTAWVQEEITDNLGGGGAVSSVSGTANQVTSSPTTGAVVVGLATNATLPGTPTVATPPGSSDNSAAVATTAWAKANTVGTATGTANQIAVSGATGAVTFSIPSSPTLPGTPTVATPPSAGDSSSKVATTSFTAALAQVPLSGWVYVTGLVNDSGASNQLAAIQTAENLLPASGGWLMFPALTIGVSQWQPKSGTNVMGAGGGSQFADGATTFVLPTGDTTSQYCVNLANNQNVWIAADVDGLGIGAQDANGAGYATSMLITGTDQVIDKSHFRGGAFASFQSVTNGTGRTRLSGIITEGTVNSTVRTISGTAGISTNSSVLTDSSVAGFTAADVGRGISPNNVANGGSNSNGIPVGTRLNNFFSIRSGTAANVAAILTAGTINLTTNSHLVSAPANISVMTSKGPTTFQYMGVSGSGATTQLTGVTYVTGASGSTSLVATGANAVNTTTIKLDQPATATNAAATVTLTQGYTAIIGSTDTEMAECRFVRGTTVFGNENNSSAIQATLCHFTNVSNNPDADNAGNCLFESSASLTGCYFDSCPSNGSLLVHKNGVKQVFIENAYIYNNRTGASPWLYTEMDNATGITLRGGDLIPPQSPWAGLVNIQNAVTPVANTGINITGIHAVDNTVFSGSTFASLVGGSVSAGYPFGTGQMADIFVNGARLDFPQYVVSKSANYTAFNKDIVSCTAGAGGFTVTSPAAAVNAQFTVTKRDAGAGSITVTAASGTINGTTSRTISNQYTSETYVSDGTNWIVV